MTTAANEHPSLPELLSVRALGTPRSRLLIDVAGGLLVAAAAIWARPFGWFSLGAAGLCLGAYGAWALAERRLEDPRELTPGRLAALEMLQGIMAPIGIAAALAFAFGLLAIAFGRAIS